MRLKQSLAVVLAAAAPVAIGDVLLIESMERAAEIATLRPSRGVTMASVEASFGAPEHRKGPVGEPPITRWDYADFVVYFEHDRVIHSVARR